MIRSSERRLPRISLCVMVRDELDVLPAFVGHHSRLVDRILFVDHRSVDGTRSFLEHLAENPPASCAIEVLLYDQPGYHQAAISRLMVDQEFRGGAEWVILLDADEFIDVGGRDELVEALLSAGDDVGVFTWVNVLPIEPRFGDDGTETFTFEQPFVTISSDCPPDVGKVAIPAAVWRANPHLSLPMGNHWVSLSDGGPMAPAVRVGHILHAPARSVAQVVSKRRNIFAAIAHVRAGYSERAQHERQLRAASEVLRSRNRHDAVSLFESVVLHYEPRLRDRPRDEWTVAPVVFPALPPVDLRTMPSGIGVADGADAMGGRTASTSKPHIKSLRRRVQWRARRTGHRVVVRPTMSGLVLLVAASVQDPARSLADRLAALSVAAARRLRGTR